jgi:hypothetical protein
MVSELDVRNDMDTVRENRVIPDHQFLHVAGMDDELVSAMYSSIQYPLRRFARRLVAWMCPVIMNGQYESTSREHCKEKVEP